MPGKNYSFGDTVYDLIIKSIRDQIYGFAEGGRLNLGGGEGEDGGIGGPPAPFVGQLAQKYVAYDTTEAETPELYGTTKSGWDNSLVDNLNHARYWQKPARWFEPIFDDTYQVEIRPGRWWRGSNTFLDFAGGDITVTSPDAQSRIDVIYVDTAGALGISEGTPSDTPTVTYPSVTSLSICEVYIKASGIEGITVSGLGYTYQSGYAQGYLQRDIRPFFGANFDQEIAGAQYLADLLDVASTTPQHMDVLSYDSYIGYWKPLQWAMGGLAGGHPTLQVDGPIVPLTHVGGAYIFTRSGEINSAYLYCEEPGTAGSTIVDVNLNGVSIFTSGWPELAYNDINQIQKSMTLSGVAFIPEDLLTIDIDQVADNASGMTVVVATDIPNDHPHSLGPHTGVLALDELQDGLISGYPLLSEGHSISGGPNYGQLGTIGIQDGAVTADKLGVGILTLSDRQGGSATDWSNGTTPVNDYDLTGEDLKMQIGSLAVTVPGGAHTQAFTVTFPEPFSNPPHVTTSMKSISAGILDARILLDTVTASQFTGWAGMASDPAITITVMWTAIGEA